MARRIAFSEELCTNCHLCAMYCSLAFGESGVFEYRPAIARIRVTENDQGSKYVAHVCLQCQEPACVEACQAGAVNQDPLTGLVTVAKDDCTGCEACVEACEFDGIFMVEGLAVKCEVCDDPLCVRACAVKALELVEDRDSTEQASLYKEVRL